MSLAVTIHGAKSWYRPGRIRPGLCQVVERGTAEWSSTLSSLPFASAIFMEG